MIIPCGLWCRTIRYHDTEMCESQSSEKIDTLQGLRRATDDKKIFHVR